MTIVPRVLVVPHSGERLDSVERSLQAAIDLETESDAMVREAQKDGGPLGAARLPPLVSAAIAARNGRMVAEKAVRAMQREAKILVPLEEAQSLCTRVMQPIIVQLRALSKRAARCNPTDRVLAETIISQETEKVIAKAQKLLIAIAEGREIEEEAENV